MFEFFFEPCFLFFPAYVFGLRAAIESLAFGFDLLDDFVVVLACLFQSGFRLGRCRSALYAFACSGGLLLPAVSLAAGLLSLEGGRSLLGSSCLGQIDDPGRRLML